ncbi:MAG: ABC transporter substrate-binding protein [Succiniclasticum sp.]|jgi:putative ABC transport system substrate-binding protein|uniref:ABC transporter substrate-binding protein n=1 Tax=Succiniclasticum sp. TaxID=2775030 RepID=UPI002A91DCD2|nr:ABC transporter substrate-binding protein [Succiniclasticum sp.]MDY6291332.1 ABC transporter substrate-binding protein [Succiniclasticum sp.]
MFFKGKKFLAVGMLLSMMAFAAAGCGGGGDKKAEPAKKAEGKVYNVGIVQLVEHQALDDSRKGFIEGMKKKGFEEGKNVKYDVQNAQADQSNLQTIAQRFVNNKVDLICAIATPSAQTMANATKEIPIVGSAITSYESAKLVKSDKKPETNVTGTSDMAPVAAQLDLGLKLKAGAKKVGLMFTSSEMNSHVQIKMAEEHLKKLGVAYEEGSVNTVNDIQEIARGLISKGVDFIYVPTDNVIASATPALVAIANEAKVPVIAADAILLKNGATASVNIEYYQLGVTSGEMAADILSGKAKPQDMPIAFQKDFTPSINKAQAEKLGLKVPEDLAKFAK